jgi:WXG100 family type VII secretion target
MEVAVSDTFAVDPEGLAKHAPNVRAFSDQMRAVVTRLHSQLDSLGDCWGDDSMGKAFESQYTDSRDRMLEGLTGISDVLDSTAEGLETMAKGLADAESQNVASARALNQSSSDTGAGPLAEPKTSAGTHAPARR